MDVWNVAIVFSEIISLNAVLSVSKLFSPFPSFLSLTLSCLPLVPLDTFAVAQVIVVGCLPQFVHGFVCDDILLSSGVERRDSVAQLC